MTSLPRAYGGDLRELARSPLALAGALVGCGLTAALIIFLVLELRRDCIADFERAWVEQGQGEVFHEAFSDAVVSECGSFGRGVCRQDVELRWRTEGREIHAVAFSLSITEACPRETSDDSAFEIAFEPGTVVKLGMDVDVDPRATAVPPEAPSEAQAPQPAVTDDEDAQPLHEVPAQVEREPAGKPRRDDTRSPSKLPVPIKPFDGLPTPAVHKGDPFGDADGWSELEKNGDPWATAVMKALAGLPVGAFGAQMGEGTARFQITVCKDGSVKRVKKTGGSLDAAGQSRVANAVRLLRFPKPPPAVASRMPGRCAKIKYTFVWSSDDVE